MCDSLGWGRHDTGSDLFLGIEREHAKVLPVLSKQIFEIERLRMEWNDRKVTTLLSLLQEFSSRKATDDRDKVFALLGLASDIKTIKPDYALSTVQVYRLTVIDLIKYNGSLTALSGDMKRKNSRGIPTWIPDWSVAKEEPDRRRMQLEGTYRTSPQWRIERAMLVRQKTLAKNLVAESIMEKRLRSLTSEATMAIKQDRMSTDSMTFDGPLGTLTERELLGLLSDLMRLASEILNLWIRPDTLQAVEQTKHACKALINLHHNNLTDTEYDYPMIFSTAFSFIGPATWMRRLRDNGPRRLYLMDERFLEFRKQKQHEAFK
ncbi:hypothetical protein F53441_882 [Fusarium austroafricanum]|uniref:Uncharacterized protein n=1 Tax=Fusarium austroafricanum TaxID=2364996 RepID=A0A8H4NZM1_9HYPO|nr:hypothetical protein F53441_882 [Fusarium austroafricanum]